MSLDFSLLDEREEPKLKVNFCMEEELRCIPGVGAQLAHTIVMLRMSHGNMDAELLCKLMRKPLSQSSLQKLDFTPNPEYDGFINEYGTWGRAMLDPASDKSQNPKVGGAGLSRTHSSSIPRLMGHLDLTANPSRHVSLQNDLMTIRINKEINNMEESLSSSLKPGMPSRDYSAIKLLDLGRDDLLYKGVDPSEINGSPLHTSDVKPDPFLLASRMSGDQSDSSRTASKMDEKPKPATSKMESKMATTINGNSRVNSPEANASKRSRWRHSHESRKVSVSSQANEEPPVTKKKSKKRKESRRKSRESSLSTDSSSTEESPVRKTKEKGQRRSQRRKHRSCSSADEEPPVSNSRKNKKQSRKSKRNTMCQLILPQRRSCLTGKEKVINIQRSPNTSAIQEKNQ